MNETGTISLHSLENENDKVSGISLKSITKQPQYILISAEEEGKAEDCLNSINSGPASPLPHGESFFYNICLTSLLLIHLYSWTVIFPSLSCV